MNLDHSEFFDDKLDCWVQVFKIEKFKDFRVCTVEPWEQLTDILKEQFNHCAFVHFKRELECYKERGNIKRKR